MKREGIDVITTKVGDRYVLEAMREHGAVLGGEQSGHIIFGDIEKTGDGIMTSLRVMEVIRAERETLAELVRPVRLFPQKLVNVTVGDKDAAMGDGSVTAAVAAAEERLAGNGRILVRASGTEPLVRVMVEAETEDLAAELAESVADVIRALA